MMTARARSDKDYYAIMGLTPDAAEGDELRRAYRRLALQWHPDRNPGHPQAADRFKEISEAYAVLSDPARRREYDRARAAGAGVRFEHAREDLFRDLAADPWVATVFEELARELSRAGVRVDRRYVEQTLGGGRGVVTGRVIVITPFTPLRLLFHVARAAVRGPREAAPPARPVAPPRPRGGVLGGLARLGRWLLGLPSGAQREPRALGDDDVLAPLRLTRAEAARGGRKRVTVEWDDRADQMLVAIPPGIHPGTRLRLRRKGRSRPNGSRGDLYLDVEVTD